MIIDYMFTPCPHRGLPFSQLQFRHAQLNVGFNSSAIYSNYRQKSQEFGKDTKKMKFFIPTNKAIFRFFLATAALTFSLLVAELVEGYSWPSSDIQQIYERAKTNGTIVYVLPTKSTNTNQIINCT